MSIETVPSNFNAFDEFEESAEARRLWLHAELAAVTRRLHELMTRHSELTLERIVNSEANAIAPVSLGEAEDKEFSELTEAITAMREDQRRLISKTAITNTQIRRPAQIIDSRGGTPRDKIEQPLLVEIYNDGIDPDTLPLKGDPNGENPGRYLPNAAL